MKDNILNQLASHESVARVIFTTSALGMGVDAPSIRDIIRIPHTLETYFQETGMAWRDNNKAKATPLYNNNDIQRSLEDIDQSIRNHCHNEAQRFSEILSRNFKFKLPRKIIEHNCCDVSKERCTCDLFEDNLADVELITAIEAMEIEILYTKSESFGY